MGASMSCSYLIMNDGSSIIFVQCRLESFNPPLYTLVTSHSVIKASFLLVVEPSAWYFWLVKRMWFNYVPYRLRRDLRSRRIVKSFYVYIDIEFLVCSCTHKKLPVEFVVIYFLSNIIFFTFSV
jgi:hypothetical protein